MEKPSYFAVIPASVRYDKRLKPIERLLFGEITCLTNKDGYCYASSSYFAELYETKRETISRYISNLAKCGYILIEIENGYQRKIYLKEGVIKQSQGVTESSQGYDQTITPPCDQTITQNNTRINNYEKNGSEPGQTDFVEVSKEYDKRYPMTLSSFKSQQLADILKNYGKEAVLFAIRESLSANAKQPIPYIRSVAMNYSRQKENDQKVEPKKESLEEIGERITAETEKARAEGRSMTPEQMKRKVLEEMKRKGMTIVGTGTDS